MPKLSISFFQKFLAILLISGVIVICGLLYFSKDGDVNFQTLSTAFLIGIIAQMIDGAIGMAYGITATTFLLTQGIPPAIASSSIHIAEIFTTGASGLSHWRLNNIEKNYLLIWFFPVLLAVFLEY